MAVMVPAWRQDWVKMIFGYSRIVFVIIGLAGTFFRRHSFATVLCWRSVTHRV